MQLKLKSLFFLIATMTALSFSYSQSQNNTNEKEKTKIVVTNFFIPTSVREELTKRNLDMSNVAALGETLATQIISSIQKETTSVQFPERRELDQVLNELQMDESGLVEISEDVASRLGKMLSADFVLIGTVVTIAVRKVPNNRKSILEMSRDIREVIVSIQARLVKVETAEIIAAHAIESSHRLQGDDGSIIEHLFDSKSTGNPVIITLSKISEDIAQRIIPFFSTAAIRVQKVIADNNVVLNIGEVHGARKGDHYEVYVILDIDKNTGYKVRTLYGIFVVEDVQPMGCSLRMIEKVATDKKLKLKTPAEAIKLNKPKQ